MKKLLLTASLYTLFTAVILGLMYPLLVTGLAQLFFKDKANGQLITRNGELVGSSIIGQPFTGASYFHSRPSAADTGYSASASSGSNFAPTNRSLIDRIEQTVKVENNGADIPIDLVTASGSGLDPDISPAAAFYQADRVAKAQNLSIGVVRELIANSITPRQFGLLGEPTVNVLKLNLALGTLDHPGDVAR